MLSAATYVRITQCAGRCTRTTTTRRDVTAASADTGPICRATPQRTRTACQGSVRGRRPPGYVEDGCGRHWALGNVEIGARATGSDSRDLVTQHDSSLSRQHDLVSRRTTQRTTRRGTPAADDTQEDTDCTGYPSRSSLQRPRSRCGPSRDWT
jgi:hypothetical protein